MANSTKFWCHRCNDAFNTGVPSEETLFAQCPACNSDCLDFETELQDAKRFEFSDEINGSIGGALLGGLIGMLGFGGRPASDSGARARILVYAEETNYQPAWTIFSDEADALSLQNDLGNYGIICEVVPYHDSKFHLIFDHRDLERAKKQIKVWAAEPEEDPHSR